ncbi:hypothetical protein ACH5RR_034715 [Cinchona calisaya]|uniref:Homeodomain-like superfamily protein n=1 Tax=Cinchona calisaya TaxID=153742 RepID=A0ABD2YF42_9GENT
MGEKSKKPRKNFITEEDISTLLQRYTATTVLTLLQEVAQVQDSKIDWNFLAKKSTTGISNPREYQMLWRHLAYHDALLDRLDDVAQPLDDDSDLECELEAFPAVCNEALTEAAACVKVLIGSGPNDPNGSTVEASLTINIPKGQMSRVPENSHANVSMQGTNITFPISVQKQSLPSVASAEALDSNGAANANLARRKRKAWSAAEDLELVAAVQKFGEGNWANILKGDFKSDRTALQLSQRWAIIKKRKGNLTVESGSQLSEAQLAARRAMSLALNMPMGDTLRSSFSIASGANAKVAHSNLGPPPATETSSIVMSSRALTNSVSTAGHQIGSSKSQVATKNPSNKSALSQGSMVKAAAVAAGARIATPSDAASLLKAAQSTNAVHIMPGGSVLKSSTAGNANSLPSNVHFIRTGLASKPLSTCSATAVNSSQTGGTQQVKGTSATPLNQPNSTATTQKLSAPSEIRSAAISSPISRLELKAVGDSATFSSADSDKEILQEEQAGFKCNRPNEQNKDLTAVSGNTQTDKVQADRGASGHSCSDSAEGGQASFLVETSKEHTSGDVVSASATAIIKQAGERQIDSPSSGMATSNVHPGLRGNQASTKFGSMNKDIVTGMPVEHTSDNQSTNEEIFENKNMEKREEGPVTMDLDGNDGQAKAKLQEAGAENGSN